MPGSVFREDEQLPSNYPAYTSGCGGRSRSHNSRQPSHGHGSSAVPKEDSPSASPVAKSALLKTQTADEVVQNQILSPKHLRRSEHSFSCRSQCIVKLPQKATPQIPATTLVIHRSAQRKDIQEPVIHPAKSVSPPLSLAPSDVVDSSVLSSAAAG
ncbi:hypothetical protein V8C44DRAFT_327170 [Trichoderma aethiopicum]